MLTNVTSPAIDYAPSPAEAFLANVRNIELICGDDE